MQTDGLRSRLETTTNLTTCRWRILSTGAEESYRDIPSIRSSLKLSEIEWVETILDRFGCCAGVLWFQQP